MASVKGKTILLVILGIVLIGFSILVWANQTGYISIFGAGSYYNISSGSYNETGDGLCPNTGYGSTYVMTGLGNQTGTSGYCGIVTGAISHGAFQSVYGSPGGTVTCQPNSWLAGAIVGLPKKVWCETFHDANTGWQAISVDAMTIPTGGNFGPQCPQGYALYGIQDTDNNNTIDYLYCSRMENSTPTSPTTQPTQPSGGSAPIISMSVTPSQINPGQTATLSWNISNGTSMTMTADCSVFESGRCFGPSTFEISANGSLQITKAQANTGYSFSILATNAYGSATEGAGLTVTAGSPSTPTVAPTPTTGNFTFKLDSSACENGAQVNKFSWTPSSGAAKYGFITRPQPNDTGVNVDTTETSYIWNSSTFGQSWYTAFDSLVFEVVAQYGQDYTWATPQAGNGATVVQSHQTHYGLQVPKLNCAAPTPAPTKVSTPTNLTAELVNTSDIKLTWTAPSNADSSTLYDIYNADTNQKIQTTALTTWTLSGATCNTTYRFYVRAFNNNNPATLSDNSNTASVQTGSCVTPDTEKPTTPANLTAIATNSGAIAKCLEIQLSWKASTDNIGVTGYDIYDGKNDQLITTTSNISHIFNNISENTEYSYYVKAHDAAGNISDKSDTTTVKTGSCKSVAPQVQSSNSISSLVKTGSSLWINILIAVLAVAGVGYFMFRDEIWQKNK